MAEFFLMPAASPTMELGKLVAWRVKEGDTVKPSDVLAEVETDKAVAEIEVFDPGVVIKILHPVGAEVPVDSPIAVMGDSMDEDIASLLATLSSKPDPVTAAEPEEETPRIKAGPAARRSAQDLGVDLRSVKGSGPGGRVMRQDVERAVPDQSAASLKETGLVSFSWMDKGLDPSIMEPAIQFVPKHAYPHRRGSASKPTGPAAPAAEVIPNSMMRKTIARRLKESWLDAPVFYLNAKFNCEKLVAFRAQLKEAGVRVSYNDMVVKAVAKALQEVPAVNASWSMSAITRHGQVNVGIAVALPDGLITPVITDADQKSLPVIAREIRELAGLAREMKLQPENYQGSTFTVSNLGMMGIEHFTAIINPPNSAILAVGSLQQEPVVVDGGLTVGWRMKVTMSCDHRVIDGALGARFLQVVRKYIESPILMYIESPILMTL